MFALARRISRSLLLVLLLTGGVLSLPQSAWAQRKGLNDKLLEEDTSKSYTLPYALVVLGIALGLMIVARPGVRLDAPKLKSLEDDDE